ncbi:SRPBCC family protein [Mycobacterium hubeiense]|uniref:SRPBCC family protein n=1 Tax=Mycobacterium hubeiense TaxID=1867256 RepID=UPI000C7F5AA2|nr:SRPBCC family protein [Mycobacterium sp. QGD 101]
MELVNEFRVPVPADKAWEVLTDVERIAPCMPGAQLLSVDGDEFTGAVKVKVGPITVQYKGKAQFVEKDAAAHRAVIKANGKETRGQGNAAALVTAELKDEGDSTTCVLTTDLTITGKAAQFGRGVLADVAGKLIGQFADRLEADVLADSRPAAAAASNASEAPAPMSQFKAAQQADDTGSVDLLSVVAGPIAKRVAPVAGGLAVGLLVGWLLGRRGA